MRRALLCGVAALTTLAAVSPAHAWKPKTHIYLAEEALRLLVVVGAGEQELGVAVDDREQVVEIVGDATGQQAEGFQVAGLEQLLLARQRQAEAGC